MDVLVVLLFVSLVFVTGAVLFFVRAAVSGEFDQGDRLSLLPLESDSEVGPDAQESPNSQEGARR